MANTNWRSIEKKLKSPPRRQESLCLAYRRSRCREESPGCASFGDEFRRSGGGLALRVIHPGPPEFAGFQPAGALRPAKRFRVPVRAGGSSFFSWRSWRLGGESNFWNATGYKVNPRRRPWAGPREVAWDPLERPHPRALMGACAQVHRLCWRCSRRGSSGNCRG